VVNEEGARDMPAGVVVLAGDVDAEEVLLDSPGIRDCEARPDFSTLGAEVGEGTPLPAEVCSTGVIADRPEELPSDEDGSGIDLVESSVWVNPALRARIFLRHRVSLFGVSVRSGT
jgi:hypothetical protein